MHIDHDQLGITTESDVEQKVVMPLLAGAAYLAIPERAIFTKQYLVPSVLDKAAGRVAGYYPDYTVWMRGFPLLVVEAKAPDVNPEVGYREASLYARHLNQAYPTKINPSRFLIATNGKRVLFGYWDSNPVLDVMTAELRPGSTALASLQEKCGSGALEAHALHCLDAIRAADGVYPYALAGGSALLHAKLPPNAFAAELSPILRRYFLSGSPDSIREIIERAYVTSDEITEYDKVLEALLKDRLAVRRGGVVQALQPGRHGEEHVANVISAFDRLRPEGGQLQIIQGSVGCGKSLFIQRYKALGPEHLSTHIHWAVVDFNTGPADLSRAERWLCSAFVEDFERNNPSIDSTAPEVLRGMFSANLQRRRTYYDGLKRLAPERAEIEKASDLVKWREDPEETARGIAQYILGSRHEVLVVVMDNVDRLDLKSQLEAFQLTLWFMQRTRCFVILQMRDETYDRYKDRPPLDTFRTGMNFHITPPRFIDVVKRRLELSLEHLQGQADNTQRYNTETGVHVTYHKSEIADFLALLYNELFNRKRNISRVLEAIAGGDVRRALDMFVSIITSGHFSESVITANVLGRGYIGVSEQLILKILMRVDYRFFSDHTGFVSNILASNPDWQKPDNFLLVEALYFLALNRKRVGQIGIEGYFTCDAVAYEMQRYGYVYEDVLAGLNLLLVRKLITADHMNFAEVGAQDSVRIHASGFMHVRVLCGRMEYLYGIIPTTPIYDREIARRLADVVGQESVRGRVASFRKLQAVEMFYEYLRAQQAANATPFSKSGSTGTDYVLKQINSAIGHFRNAQREEMSGPDPLDGCDLL